MAKTTEKIYIQWCAAIEVAASQMLDRALTRPELRGIRNAGSLMMLEAVERGVASGTDPLKVAADLISSGVAFEERRRSIATSTASFAEESLGRSLAVQEAAAFRQCEFVTDLMRVSDDLAESEQDQKEHHVARFVEVVQCASSDMTP